MATHTIDALDQRPDTMPCMSTEIIWTGRPSQLVNFWWFVLGGLLFFLVVPLILAIWKYLDVRCTTFELTPQRLRRSTGVFNRVHHELELYRVKDYVINQPFWQRIFGLGTVILETSDRTHPTFVIPAIADSTPVRDHIREQVEYLRETKKVREIDFQDGDIE